MKLLFYSLDLYSTPYNFNRPENCCSACLSLITITTILLVVAYSFYTEVYYRKIESITYLGKQSPQTQDRSDNISISINFKDLATNYCYYFYREIEEDSETHFLNNSTNTKNITVNFSSVNKLGDNYYIAFYVKCSAKESYTNGKINYLLNITYDYTMNNLLDINNPVQYIQNTFQLAYHFFYPQTDFAPKQLTGFDLRLNYFYNRIVDDKGFFYSNPLYTNETGTVYFSGNDLEKSEYFQPFPEKPASDFTKAFPPLRIFTLRVNKAKEDMVSRRNFTSIPSMLAKVVGVFSTLKFFSLVLLFSFNYRTKEFHLFNKAFKMTKEKKKDHKSETSSSQSPMLKDQRRIMFSWWDNVWFSFCCNCVLSKRTIIKKKIFYHLRALTKNYSNFHNYLSVITILNPSIENKGNRPSIVVEEDMKNFKTIDPPCLSVDLPSGIESSTENQFNINTSKTNMT